MDWAGFLTDPGREPDEEHDLFIGQSVVASMDLCPARVGYAREEGFNAVPSEAMSFGTVGHYAIEWMLRNPESARLWTAPELKQIWADELLNPSYEGATTDRGGHVLEELVTPAKLATSLDDALAMILSWQEDVYPLLRLSDELQIEETVTKPLGVIGSAGHPLSRAVWYVGTADVADGGEELLIDWKTANSGWHESRAHASPQPSGYGWLYDIYDTHFWVWDRKRQRWDRYVTGRTHEQVQAYLRHAWMRAKQIDAQSFPATAWESNFGKYKRAWHCSAKYCGAWDVCEFKNLHDDVWEEQRIDILDGWK
jgi:hypothetical protein